MFKKLFPSIICLISLAIVVFLVPSKHNSATISITTNTGKEVLFNLTHADTPEKRERGLMYVATLADDAAMLFIFAEESRRDFWMRNTLMPLDMIFFNTDFQIVDIIENAMPCTSDPCTVYSSLKPAQYVLEIKAGQTKAKQIQIGNQAKWYR